MSRSAAALDDVRNFAFGLRPRQNYFIFAPVFFLLSGSQLSPSSTLYRQLFKMVQNKSLIFVEPVPAGTYPVAGKHLKQTSDEFDLEQSLPAGSILVKTKVLSLDPYMRSRLRAPGYKSYVPEFTLEKPLQNFGV